MNPELRMEQDGILVMEPYRKDSRIALEDIARLSKKDAKNLAGRFIDIDSEILYGLDMMYTREKLLALGYQQEDNSLYLRRNAILPVFPAGMVKVDDRFVAIPPGYKTEDGKAMIISGKYDDNLERLVNDIEIMKNLYDIRFAHKNKKHLKIANPLINASAVLGIATIMWSTGFAGSPPDMGTMIAILLVLGVGTAGTFGSGIAIKSKVRKKLSKEAENLSLNANEYLFGEDVYKQIESEFRGYTISKKRLSQYEAIKEKGIELTPEEFLKLESAVMENNFKALDESAKVLGDNPINAIIPIFRDNPAALTETVEVPTEIEQERKK